MLELKKVTKRYKDKTALLEVSLCCREGIYGLLGPNGAGKSTMMNLITGNLIPDQGSICWNGREIRSMGADYRSLLGYAPQQQGLYDSFSGRRFLAYMAALKGIPKKETKREIDRVLSYVNMEEKADYPIRTYSGGMKQRILIAQAILGDPKLIVFDEPTAGLDPRERVRIREKIRKIGQDRIILLSTHVVSDIESIADEIILLKSGRIVGQDSVEALCAACSGAENLEEVYLHFFGEEEAHAADRL